MDNESETGTSAPGVYAKLNTVMGKVGRIAKRGRNDYHGYDYVTEADIVDEIRPLMADAGLAFIPSQGGERQEVTVQTKSGETTVVKILHTFRFVDTEDGSEVEVAVWGEGQDSMDKGSYKAFTGAEKYALLKTFMVATGDDPERDASRERTARKANGRERSTGGGGQSSTSGADTSDLRCPDCGGPIWDNRADKKAGEVSKKYPNFKCRDRECDWASWDDEDETFGTDTVARPLDPFPELQSGLLELEGLNEERAANARAWMEGNVDEMRQSPQALSAAQERLERAIAEERADDEDDEDEGVQNEDRSWVEATLDDYYGEQGTWDAKLRMLGTVHPNLTANWPTWDAMRWNTARRYIETHEKEGMERPQYYAGDEAEAEQEAML